VYPLQGRHRDVAKVHIRTHSWLHPPVVTQRLANALNRPGLIQGAEDLLEGEALYVHWLVRRHAIGPKSGQAVHAGTAIAWLKCGISAETVPPLIGAAVVCTLTVTHCVCVFVCEAGTGFG